MMVPFLEAETPLQHWLMRRYEKVLGIKGVGIGDNFFTLGGHSLNAAHLAELLSDDFGIDISLALVFRAPTIFLLAEALTEQTKNNERLRVIAETYLYVDTLSANEIRERLKTAE
jgi:hypothetical protein